MHYPDDIPYEGQTVWIKNPNGEWDQGYILENLWYLGVENDPNDILAPYNVTEWREL